MVLDENQLTAAQDAILEVDAEAPLLTWSASTDIIGENIPLKTQKAITRLATLQAGYSDGLEQLYPHVDLRRYPEDTAEGSKVLPRSLCGTVNPDAQFRSEYFTSRLFGTIIGVRLEDRLDDDGNDITDATINEALAAIKALIPVESSDGPRFNVVDNDTPLAKDARMWKMNLGRYGQVTVRKQEKRHNVRNYSLWVQVDASKAGQDLLEHARKQPEMTFKEFVTSPAYVRVEKLTERNARRIAATVAEHLGYSVNTVPDLWAKTPKNRPQPDLAVPDVENTYNRFISTSVPWNLKQSALVWNGETTNTHKQAVKGGIINVGRPIDPLRVYRFNEKERAHGGVINMACNSFPIVGGIAHEPEQPNEKELKFITNYVHHPEQKVVDLSGYKSFDSRSNEFDMHKQKLGVEFDHDDYEFVSGYGTFDH